MAAPSPMKILVVDDSVVFRSQIKSALENVDGILVVGVASNGKLALEKLAQTAVDLITLDLEMPEMDGLETLRQLKLLNLKPKVIVFAAKSRRGADGALEALNLGAADFVAKPQGGIASIEDALAQVRSDLIPKILQWLPRASAAVPSNPEPASPLVATAKLPSSETFQPAAVVIASSTGGPDALEKVFSGFPAQLKVPVFLAQHMPPVFTASLASRLSRLSGLAFEEGKHGEKVQAGRIYVAPGDYHMSVVNRNGIAVIHLDQGPKRNFVRPAADTLFESVAAFYGKSCLGVVLTGMGEDGLVGCRALKEAGARVMIQDAASCVVFGMPGAIHKAGLYDGMGDLADIQRLLAKAAGYRKVAA